MSYHVGHAMKAFGFSVAEGSNITNLVAPSGTNFPLQPNEGELFYVLPELGPPVSSPGLLYYYANNTWNQILDSTSGVSFIAGSVDQVRVAGNGTGFINLSLPQSIATNSSVTFGNITNSALTANGALYARTGGLLTSTPALTNGQILIGSTGAVPAAGTLTAGTGVGIVNGAASITISNTGVTSATAGNGISVSSASGAITITNTGLSSVVAGSGISVANSAGTVTISNTGIINAGAGEGISVANTFNGELTLTGITISNNGVLSVVGTAGQVLVNGGSGVPVAGRLTLTLPQSIATNSSVTFGNITDTALTANGAVYAGDGGLLSSTTALTNGQLLIGSTGTAPVATTITAGSAISVTNGAGSISIANTGVTSAAAGTGISVSSATGGVTIANTGVTSITAGSGISVSASTGSVTISSPAGVMSVALDLPTIFSVTGSPVTSTGTLSATFVSQAAGTVLDRKSVV